MSRNKKQDNKKIITRILLAALEILLLAGAIKLSMTFFEPLVGKNRFIGIRKLELHSGQTLDLSELKRFGRLNKFILTETDFSIDEYKALRELYPEAEILWNIPVNGEMFVSSEKSLTFDNIPEDIENIRLFTGLETLKIEHCPDPQAMLALEKEFSNIKVDWNVLIDGKWYPLNTESLVFDNIPEDIANISLLKSLKSLKIEHCPDPEAMLALQAQYSYLNVDWNLRIAHKWYPLDTETLSFEAGEIDYDEFMFMAAYFTKLKTVNISGTDLNSTQQVAMKTAFPYISFNWDIIFNGTAYPTNTKTLRFPNTDPGIKELEAALFMFSDLKAVDFNGSTMSGFDRSRFRANHPELDVSWEVELMGQTYPCTTEELDFNDVPIESNEELMAALPYFPDLKRVELDGCGLSDESIGELFDAFPNVKFVWTIYFGNYYLRTDAEYFIPSAWKDGVSLMDRDFKSMRYCTDLVALDLGHTHVVNVDFVRYMPKLKYLILVDTSVTDISPLADCKELKFLECYMLRITDFSPLLGCPKLEYINIGYTRSYAPATLEVLKQMTQLKRLWFCGCPFNYAQIDELKAALPDCEMYLAAEGQSTGSTWRYHESYYEMRDAFNMFYMPGGTIGVDYRGYQEIKDDWGRVFVLVGWDGRQRWWEQDEFKNWDYHIVGINCDK